MRASKSRRRGAPRLLGISGVKPFIVQNLGKYEGQAWQAAEFGLGDSQKANADSSSASPPQNDTPSAVALSPTVTPSPSGCHSEPIRPSSANRSERSEEAHGKLREESAVPLRAGSAKGLHVEQRQREAAYRKFILELYHATPVTGRSWLHGMKSGRMVHVGAVGRR